MAKSVIHATRFSVGERIEEVEAAPRGGNRYAVHGAVTRVMKSLNGTAISPAFSGKFNSQTSMTAWRVWRTSGISEILREKVSRP